MKTFGLTILASFVMMAQAKTAAPKTTPASASEAAIQKMKATV